MIVVLSKIKHLLKCSKEEQNAEKNFTLAADLNL